MQAQAFAPAKTLLGLCGDLHENSIGREGLGFMVNKKCEGKEGKGGWPIKKAC